MEFMSQKGLFEPVIGLFLLEIVIEDILRH